MKSRLAQFKNIKPIFISSFSNGRTTNRQKIGNQINRLPCVDVQAI